MNNNLVPRQKQDDQALAKKDIKIIIKNPVEIPTVMSGTVEHGPRHRVGGLPQLILFVG